jgi:hypothetical protein
MNEWYAKDTSKKIRTMFKEKMQEGKRVSQKIFLISKRKQRLSAILQQALPATDQSFPI